MKSLLFFIQLYSNTECGIDQGWLLAMLSMPMHSRAVITTAVPGAVGKVS